MTTSEYAQLVLEVKNETSTPQMMDETAAYEAAQLISGSFTYPLNQALWVNHFDMDAITEHLEYMHDNGNHHGVVYFIFILSDAVDYVLPLPFSEMSANDALVPILSAAIIEDWLEYDATSEVTEVEI